MTNSEGPRGAGKVVIDSNLLIALLNLSDTGHALAEALAVALREGDYEIIAPVLYLWEFDAYLRHPEKAKKHVQNRSAKLRVTAYDVTSGLYSRTYNTAMVAIKGADRVFVSLAKDHSAPLITDDRQILRNAGALGVQAFSVAAFLAQRRVVEQ
jgi:predicted nucleic acid-binding protein